MAKKITRSQLRKIIQEEAQKLKQELKAQEVSAEKVGHQLADKQKHCEEDGKLQKHDCEKEAKKVDAGHEGKHNCDKKDHAPADKKIAALEKKAKKLYAENKKLKLALAKAKSQQLTEANAKLRKKLLNS